MSPRTSLPDPCLLQKYLRLTFLPEYSVHLGRVSCSFRLSHKILQFSGVASVFWSARYCSQWGCRPLYIRSEIRLRRIVRQSWRIVYSKFCCLHRPSHPSSCLWHLTNFRRFAKTTLLCALLHYCTIIMIVSGTNFATVRECLVAWSLSIAIVVFAA